MAYRILVRDCYKEAKRHRLEPGLEAVNEPVARDEVGRIGDHEMPLEDGATFYLDASGVHANDLAPSPIGENEDEQDGPVPASPQRRGPGPIAMLDRDGRERCRHEETSDEEVVPS